MLTPVLSVRSLGHLHNLFQWGVGEVIVEFRSFSRLGTLSLEEGQEVARAAKSKGMKVFFQWDLLMTETEMQQQTGEILALLESGDFCALRVQDVGALQWALEKTDLPLHWIAETGNGNYAALRGWACHIGARLERLVLSIEIPKESLKLYASKLNVSLEILGLGPILLFYTPRHLLGKFGDAAQQDLRASADCDENVHKGLQVLSNTHGTFLFHQKHHGTLPYSKELEQMGLTHVRLAPKTQELEQMALGLLRDPTESRQQEFKRHYPTGLMRGFYHRNKSHVLFAKLKNEDLEQHRQQALGEVIGVEKKGLLGIQLKSGKKLEKGKKYILYTPEGKKISFEMSVLKDIELGHKDCLDQDLALCGYVKGALPGALILSPE